MHPARTMEPSEIDDFTPLFPRRSRSRYGQLHANISLGLWVHQKLEKRLTFVGRNVGRIRLIPFLESLVAGRCGHSVELARAFQRIIDRVRSPKRSEYGDRPRPLELCHADGWHRMLTDLFAEQPQWETKFRAWVAEVAPSEPPPDEPVWRRIRRLRTRAGR
jgi:hypothetical protein